MRKNDAGLTILEIGDVIRKGSGRVPYTVTWVPEEHLYGIVQIEVKSHTSERLSRTNVETAVLVQSVQDAAYEAGCSVEEIKSTVTGEPVAAFTPIETASHTGEAPVKEDTEYQKAVLLALNLKGKHVYAGTVRANVKAKRRSLNKRQDQSRKANR